MAPAKKGDGKKGLSATNQLVTREHTISIHKLIHGVGFKKGVPWALKEIWKFATKKMGWSIDTRLHEAAWARGVGNAPHRIRVPLSRKQ